MQKNRKKSYICESAIKTEKDFALFQIDLRKLPEYSNPEEFSSRLKICSLLEDDVVIASNAAGQLTLPSTHA